MRLLPSLKTKVISKRKGVGIIILILCLSIALIYNSVAPGLSFLYRYMHVDLSNAQSSDQTFSTLHTIFVQKEPVEIIVHRPTIEPRGAIVLVHGVHHDGFRESRLLHFAHTLVQLGFAVVLPEITSLKNYSLLPRALDEIEQVTHWTLNQSHINNNKQVSLFGISFSGGLCLRVGARKSLHNKLSAIFSFGGHGDLDETLNYLITGQMGNNRHSRPHVYGQAVVARMYANEIVPQNQIPTLRAALLDYLHGKHSAVKKSLATLPEESKHIVSLCIRHNGNELGRHLQQHLSQISADPRLSPVKGPVPRCPVFILHGAGDNVIPPSQAERLQKWATKGTHSALLISSQIKHVDLEKKENVLSSILEYWKMIRFWTRLIKHIEN